MGDKKALIGAPTPEGFLWFEEKMKEMSFVKINKSQFSKNFQRLGLHKKRKFKFSEPEIGFAYSSHFSPYKIICWTTFMESEYKMRDKGTDLGWVIILKGDKLIYSARPFTRHNNQFFLHLARYAWIAKKRIDSNPLCPTCDMQMIIYRRRKTRSYFWGCVNKDKHEKPISILWDHGLGPKAIKFLKIRRSRTKAYNKRNQKLGRQPVPRAKTRKRWKITKPENLQK